MNKDRCGSCVEQADVDPRGVEVVAIFQLPSFTKPEHRRNLKHVWGTAGWHQSRGNQSEDRGSGHSPSLLHGYVIPNRFLPPNWATFWCISSGCVVNKTSVEVLFLSRLTWIQERLKWWMLHPGLASTQPFNFQVFIKRDEIQEEESILTTARVLTRASLQQWRVWQTVVHFSSIQVSRNGPFHNHKFHGARLFTRWNSDVNDLYTWQLMLCEPKWTFSMCVFQRLYCGKLLYWFKGGPMIPWPVRYFPVEAVKCLWNQGSCTDKSWTCFFGSTLDASGQSQRVFPEALQGRRCLQARRLRTRCRRMMLDPQEVRHQGTAVAIWRVSCCDTVF